MRQTGLFIAIALLLTLPVMAEEPFDTVGELTTELMNELNLDAKDIALIPSDNGGGGRNGLCVLVDHEVIQELLAMNITVLPISFDNLFDRHVAEEEVPDFYFQTLVVDMGEVVRIRVQVTRTEDGIIQGIKYKKVPKNDLMVKTLAMGVNNK